VARRLGLSCNYRVMYNRRYGQAIRLPDGVVHARWLCVDHLQLFMTIQQDQRLRVQHLVFDCVPETIGNTLATVERFVCEVRPAGA
jgi:hypothetical protein